jgi:hypothetical protein
MCVSPPSKATKLLHLHPQWFSDCGSWIYDTSWSKTEFCELVSGQKGPTLVLFGGEAGIRLSGFANSQNNRQSKKLYYVTLKLGASRAASDWDWLRPPPPLHRRTTALITLVEALTLVELHEIVKLQTNFELGNNQCIYHNKSLKNDNLDTHLFSRSTKHTSCSCTH